MTDYSLKFSIDVSEDDTPVRGNFMQTDDPEQDTADENEILSRLDNGDMYAWCSVTVTAKFGDLEGSDSLHACNFAANITDKEIEDWVKFEGLKENAFANLMEKAAEIEKQIAALRQVVYLP